MQTRVLLFLCCSMALSFTACQWEEDLTSIQQRLEEGEDPAECQRTCTVACESTEWFCEHDCRKDDRDCQNGCDRRCEDEYRDCKHACKNNKACREACEAPLQSCRASCTSQCTAAASQCQGTCQSRSETCNDSCVERCTPGPTACPSGTADCDGDTSNGCETNLQSSASDCGACGNVCSFPNATPACQMGVCVPGSCDGGFANCDQVDATGCEVSIDSDVNNCGACGNVCSFPNATPNCQSGACGVASCDTGFASCDGSPVNGCEVDTRTDLNHCGTCDNACSFANASAACTDGACAIAACHEGFADCDGDPSNGCEANLGSDLSHCGACGTSCDPANGSGVCQQGVCGISMCSPGFADCDGSVGNGCEVNTTADAGHCGGCGNVCQVANGTGACQASACVIGTCNTGSADCDGSYGTGCETNTAADAGNCGACGNVCTFANASATCQFGSCALGTCSTGFRNCDNNPSNGCEVNTTSDPSHCGSCGNVCPGSPGTCQSSACVTTCAPGTANCDGLASNGCEKNIATDPNNCGRCGRICIPGWRCVNGGCTP